MTFMLTDCPVLKNMLDQIALVIERHELFIESLLNNGLIYLKLHSNRDQVEVLKA